MLELRFIREHIDLVRKKCIHRGLDSNLVDTFTETDSRRLSLLSEVEQLKNRRNTVSKEIAPLKKAGEHEQAEPLILEMREVSERIKELDRDLAAVQEELNLVVMAIPNICDDAVPKGNDESDNLEMRTWGDIPQFSFTPKPHWQIGEELNILDFETAAKLSGARFSLLKGFASRLSRALVNFFLDLHTQKHGYTEMLPPFMVNSQSMTGTGQLPKFKEDLFKIEGRDLWLIPTAEVPLTNIHSNETLAAADLPVK
ncbi:MAG: serine--tRNA ligase, partial [Candidatus Electrothrix sp. AR3]|nr:serine--tRNA ligase [Candidatus Electrothrix sp. AR3]